MVLTACRTRRFSGCHQLPLDTWFFWEAVLLTAAQGALVVLLSIYHFLTNMSALHFVKAFKAVQAFCCSLLKHFHWLPQTQELQQYPLFRTARTSFSVALYPFIPSQVFAQQTDVFTRTFAPSTCSSALSGWPVGLLEARHSSASQPQVRNAAHLQSVQRTTATPHTAFL